MESGPEDAQDLGPPQYSQGGAVDDVVAESDYSPEVDMVVSDLLGDSIGPQKTQEAKIALQNVLDRLGSELKPADLRTIKRLKIVARHRKGRILTRYAELPPSGRRPMPHPSEDY